MLGLLLAAALATPVELVRAIRVERDQDRLLQFVSLAAGQPLDAEAVRRSVELIFATGRYEDVRVELVRDPARTGVEVVFRPVLAPLLVGVRIEGDKVLSASAARRAARLVVAPAGDETSHPGGQERRVVRPSDRSCPPRENPQARRQRAHPG